MENNRTIEIIEDNALIGDFLNQMLLCLKKGKKMPSRIPVLNDLSKTDTLSEICEIVNNLTTKLL